MQHAIWFLIGFLFAMFGWPMISAHLPGIGA